MRKTHPAMTFGGLSTTCQGVTVRTVLTVIEPDVAVIVAVPVDNRLANPLDSGSMLATAVFDDCQVADGVRFVVVPFDINPVAVNCCTNDTARLMNWLDGVRVIDTSTGAVTVRVAWFDVTPEKAAVMVVVPCARVAANPRVPVALLTVATCVFDDAHTAEAVMSCVVLSEKVPVAVNCSLPPAAMLVAAGETEIELRVAGVTVSTAGGTEVTVANEARMFVVPVPLDSASPNVPAVFPTVATEGVEELQIAKVVRSCVPPPASVPVAVNCRDVPSAMLAVGGETAIDATAADVSVVDPETAPTEAVIVVEPTAAGTVLARPVPEMAAIDVSDEVQVTNEVKSCVIPF